MRWRTGTGPGGDLGRPSAVLLHCTPLSRVKASPGFAALDRRGSCCRCPAEDTLELQQGGQQHDISRSYKRPEESDLQTGGVAVRPVRFDQIPPDSPHHPPVPGRREPSPQPHSPMLRLPRPGPRVGLAGPGGRGCSRPLVPGGVQPGGGRAYGHRAGQAGGPSHCRVHVRPLCL